MWLIQQLARGRQPVVAVDLPQMYQEAYREVLKADPRAVNLHKFGLYFYELGSYAKEFDNKREVGDILIHVSIPNRFKNSFILVISVYKVIYRRIQH